MLRTIVSNLAGGEGTGKQGEGMSGSRDRADCMAGDPGVSMIVRARPIERGTASE